MEIMVDKPGCIEEVVKVVKDAERRYCEKNYVAGARTGVQIAKNNQASKKGSLRSPFENFYLALSYFLRGLPPKYRRR